MKFFVFFVSLSLLFALSLSKKKNKCKLNNGLACGSFETLTPGSSFSIESKKCRKGKYPKNEDCYWYFDVEGCTPTLTCSTMDIKGRGKNCRGDHLTVDAGGYYKDFCGKKSNVFYTPDHSMDWFDIGFTSDRRKEGKGFKCTVSCDAGSSTSTLPPTTAVSQECQCGVPNRVQRIVGGVETEVNEYPWQVGLAYVSNNAPFCGGSILSSTTIVTAAHCISSYTFEVIVGDHDLNIDDGEERFEVCNTVEHPDYNSGNSDYDIAIVTLCKPLTFRKEVRPVCLPDLPGSSYDNVLATVSGWGALQSGGSSPDELREVNVTTITNAECNQDYFGDVLASMICASGPGKDACQGDSGGPLITWESGQFYSLIGVVSWGYGCANPSYPGVYARVTEMLDFIGDNLGGSTCKVPSSESPATTVPSLPPYESTTSTTTPPFSSTPTPPPASTTGSPTTTPGSSGCKCGVANRGSRIVGGVQTESNEYPWQAALVDPSSTIPFCGGSIISSRTILTAAHCTQGTAASNIVVVVAEHDWTDNSDGQRRLAVCSKTEHPDYDSASVDYDFSLLTLCNDIEFGKDASPVCLPDQAGSFYDNVIATVSGWGTLSFGGSRPTTLMEVNVTTMTNTRCNQDYGGDVLDSMICASGPGKDACQGDSGGPLVTAEPDHYYSLIGVVSWGNGCASPNFPGVYSRVTKAETFILDNMRGSTCAPPNGP